MNWFKNLKIRNKFFMIFGVFLFLVAIIVTFALVSIHGLMTDYMRITDGPNKRLLIASYATVELTNVRKSNVTMATYTDNTEAAKRFYIQCNNSHDALVRILNDWQANLENDRSLPDSERKIQTANLNEVRKELAKYMGFVKEQYEALVITHDLQKVSELASKCVPTGDQLVNQLGTNRKSTEMLINFQTKAVNDKAHATTLFTIVLAAAILIFSLLKDMFISYLITSPIRNIHKSINEIERGNLNYPIRLPYKDELGQLSNHIGDMVDKISDLNSSVAILDHLEAVIFITDMDYNLIFVNNFFTKIKGMTREACLGQKCYKIVSDEEEPCPFCPLPDMFPQRETFPTSDWERPLTVEENEVWFACRTSIIRWTDGSLVLFNAYTDETAQKQHAEQLCDAARMAEDASRIKSSFLANMSHEIRTPMNGIIGFSELALDDDAISPKTKDYLEKIKASSEGLLGIINDILDISKIEAGKIVLESIPFDLHEVFKICQNIVSPRAQAKDISLFCYSEPTIGKRLVGDPVRLRQSLLNLLTNSVKFTNYGIVKLLASIIETQEDSVAIHFEVKDSGIGMTEEQLTKVFDPFTQADNSTTRKFGGTGLGLTITKNFIELMGGELKVESALGIGSRFCFDLKFPTCDVDVTAEKTEEVGKTEKPYFNAEILVCEDNEMNQIVITEHLARVGIKTYMAGNGQIGIQMVADRMKDSEKKPFDLIFMDIHMPVMDGLEAVKKLKEMGNTIPIVALTANIMTTDQETYKEYGMHDYLSKPFATQDLWGCLLKYIKPVPLEEAVLLKEQNAPDTAQAASASAGAAPAATQPSQEDEDERLRMRLISNFLKDNQNKGGEIRDAIAAGDIKLAHRLAHTLKGVAGLVGQTGLQNAAYAVEHTLNSGDGEAALKIMGALETELAKSLSELAAVKGAAEPKEASAEPAATLDKFQAIELIDRLRPLLENGDSDCLEMMDGLKSIPASQKLIEQVEDYDFGLALETLDEIKRELEA